MAKWHFAFFPTVFIYLALPKKYYLPGVCSNLGNVHNRHKKKNAPPGHQAGRFLVNVVKNVTLRA